MKDTTKSFYIGIDIGINGAIAVEIFRNWASATIFDYEIIIPKEEQKPIHQQIIDAIGGEDRFREIAKIKPKQERMYSEEEVITLLESLVEHPTKPGYKRKDILKVIEQFKKK
jgi:DNA-binding transcriptional regulator YhcF (GntR family)